MKKILSLLMVALMVVNASAVNLGARPSVKPMPTQKEMMSLRKELRTQKAGAPVRKVSAAKQEGEIKIDFTTPLTKTYYNSYSEWMLSASNDDYLVVLDYKSDDATSPKGTFTTEDFDLDYTYIRDKANSANIDIVAVSLTVKDEDGRIDVSVELTADDDQVYIVTMFFETPKATTFVDLNATNLQILSELYYGIFPYYVITASDDDNEIELVYWADPYSLDTDIESDDNLSGTVNKVGDTNTVEIYSGHVKVEATAEGYKLTGKVLDMNGVEYTLNCTYVFPDATRTLDVEIEHAEYMDQTANDGWFQLYGWNDAGTFYATFSPNSDHVAGDYTVADLDLDYSLLAEVNGADTAQLNILKAEVTVVEEANGDVVLTGKLLLQNADDDADVVDCTLKITYVKPVVIRTATITATVELNDLTASYGAWQMLGFNSDETTFISLAVYSDNVASTYSTIDIYSSYAYILEINGTDTTGLRIVEADFEVVENEDGTYSATGKVVAKNMNDALDVVEYTINLTAVVEEEDPFAYDEADDFNEIFAEYTVDDQYASYGIFYVDAENENSASLTLQITIAGATELEDGVYTIGEEVEASKGYSEEDGLLPSIVGYVNESGLYTNVWFLVSGTVTVDNGYIVVDALNSLGNTVHAELGEKPEDDDSNGLKTVKSELNTGELFNVAGQRVGADYKGIVIRNGQKSLVR